MKNLFKFLIPYLSTVKWKAIGSVLLSIPLASIMTYQLSLIRDVIDHGLQNFDDAKMVALKLIACALINYPCRFFHFYWIRFCVDKATCLIRLDIYKKLQELPLRYFQKNKQGTLLSHIVSDSQVLSQGFRGLVDFVREPLKAIAALGWAIYVDWQLTIIIFMILPLFLIIFNRSGKIIRKNMGNVQEHMAQMTHHVGEGLSGQKISKAFNLQSYVHERFQRAQEIFFNYQMKTTVAEENAHPMVEFVGAMGFAMVILFAQTRIETVGHSTGDFISFVGALAFLMDPIRKFSQANVKVSQARGASDRIQKLFHLESEEDRGTIKEFTFEDKIEIKNLNYSYDGERSIIKNLNLTINKGEKVAIVGPSGSGKSTLINLLLRLYPTGKGQITIDGKPIQDFSLQVLRGLFGLVGQEVFLFHDDVSENIKTGRPITDEEETRALKAAGAYGFVSELPKKTQTVIGDRGTRLSGGESQRLTIARAIIKDPEILLFDEATSSLDNESEKVVQEALDRISSEKTVVAVAHRLSTIVGYDKIVVLKSGEKVEEGNHQSLMERNGDYAKLYELSLHS